MSQDGCMRTIPREVRVVGGPRRDYTPAPSVQVASAYLHGALHDSTYSVRHGTIRFAQADRQWLEHLRSLLRRLGCRGWIYREGRSRQVWVLETTARLDYSCDPLSLPSRAERAAYVRGYFDAEGGLPHNPDARLYISFCQKNRMSLYRVQQILQQLGIHCGVIHCPSVRADPDDWRFYVRADSLRLFAAQIGSWQAHKQSILERRMKI